jgi:hypothetical protein
MDCAAAAAGFGFAPFFRPLQGEGTKDCADSYLGPRFAEKRPRETRALPSR